VVILKKAYKTPPWFPFVRALFYANDMKLFLPIESSQECLKIPKK
jgi:hypothetical protein